MLLSVLSASHSRYFIIVLSSCSYLVFLFCFLILFASACELCLVSPGCRPLLLPVPLDMRPQISLLSSICPYPSDVNESGIIFINIFVGFYCFMLFFASCIPQRNNLRIGKGLTQERLAELLQVSRQSVSKWELGQSV